MYNQTTVPQDDDQLPVDHPIEESSDHQQSEACHNSKQSVRFHVPSLAVLAVAFFAGVGDVINVGGGIGHNN